jgi:hypothetical protein
MRNSLMEEQDRLFDMIFDKDLDGATCLLKRHPSLAKAMHHSLMLPPLDMAAQNDAGDLAELLIEYGADPDCTSFGGETALHKAALNGSINVCKVLVRNGVNIDAVNAKTISALDYSVFSDADGAVECAKILREAGAKESVLSAIYSCDDRLLSRLVTMPESLSHREVHVTRSIPELVWSWEREADEIEGMNFTRRETTKKVLDRHINVLPLLLSNGADINAYGVIMDYPAVFVALNGARGGGVFLEALMSFGASPFVTNNIGETAIEHAMATRNHDAVRILTSPS